MICTLQWLYRLLRHHLCCDVIQRLITCVSGSILSGMDICCFFWHSTHLFPKNIKLIRLPGCQLSNEQKIFPIFSPHKIRLNFIFWQGKCFCETFYNFKLNLENNKWCTAWHFSLLYSFICWNSQSSEDNHTNLLTIFKKCQLDLESFITDAESVIFFFIWKFLFYLKILYPSIYIYAYISIDVMYLYNVETWYVLFIQFKKVELQWKIKKERNTGTIIGENYCFRRIGNCYFRLEMARIVVLNINIRPAWWIFLMFNVVNINLFYFTWQTWSRPI